MCYVCEKEFADAEYATLQKVKQMLSSEKSDYERGRKDEHLATCGWCRQGFECPYGKNFTK